MSNIISCEECKLRLDIKDAVKIPKLTKLIPVRYESDEIIKNQISFEVDETYYCPKCSELYVDTLKYCIRGYYIDAPRSVNDIIESTCQIIKISKSSL